MIKDVFFNIQNKENIFRYMELMQNASHMTLLINQQFNYTLILGVRGSLHRIIPVNDICVSPEPNI